MDIDKHTNIKTSKFIIKTGINIATRQCTSRSSTIKIYRCIPSHVIHAIVSTQSRLPLSGHNTTRQDKAHTAATSHAAD